jgi:hypothetical protein
MLEICIHIPANQLEARILRIDRDQNGVPTETPIGAPLPIDAALFAPGGALDPAAIRDLFTANHDSPDFPARGRDLMAAIGAGPVWSQLRSQTRQQSGGELKTYLHVEHPLLRDLPWELLTHGLNPLFSSSPCIRVQGWPLLPVPSDPIWPIRVFVIDGTMPSDRSIGADTELWGIRKGLRIAEHSFDLEILRTGIDPDFKVVQLEDLMTRKEDGVKRWPDGPHILHFIGHSVAGAAPALKLFVPDKGGGPGDYIDWTRAQIAILMGRLPALRLVYLNACRSNEAAIDPMAPMSAADVFLNAANAAIAMQADVRGEPAALCAGKFYCSLACGKDPDVALQEARTQLLLTYNDQSPAMYTPVMTTRVPAGQILMRKQFQWTEADHKLWQDGLRPMPKDEAQDDGKSKGKDNWGHFVDQRPRRRDLMGVLLGPKPSAPLLVHGDKQVGKTWLLRWMAYALALNGMKTLYVEADTGMDWLEVLRHIRDGTKAPYAPGLSEALRSEFNWKLNHIAAGETPTGTPPAAEMDTAGALVEITANKKVNNGFEGLICDSMAKALRSESEIKPLVLVLDDVPLTTLAVLKPKLLDQLLATAGICIILCLDTTHWDNAKKLGFEGWKPIKVTELDVLLARDLAREILRLKYPEHNTTLVETSVTSAIGVPSKIGRVYETCVLLAELNGLK